MVVVMVAVGGGFRNSSVRAPAGLEQMWSWILRRRSAASHRRSAILERRPRRLADTPLPVSCPGKGGALSLSLQSLRVNCVSFLCFSFIEKERQVEFFKVFLQSGCYIDVSHSLALCLLAFLWSSGRGGMG